MSVLRHLVTMGVISAMAVAQLLFNKIPPIPEEIKRIADGEGRSFVNLWEYALDSDGQGHGPVIRTNVAGAKTILAPGLNARKDLVPQDAPDPLYGDTHPLVVLRQQYLLDHMVSEPVKPTDADLTKRGGVTHVTLSNKEVTFRKDVKGQMFVNDVPMIHATSFKDGTQLYILQEILFDNQQRVNVAFQRHHSILEELSKPTGPPLDLSPVLPVNVRSPAPPPPGVVGPPAIPKGSSILPPAEPPFSVFFSPPAPPPSSMFFGPPAPPPKDSFTTVVLSQRQGQVRG